MDSDESDRSVDILAAFQKKSGAAPKKTSQPRKPSVSPGMFISDESPNAAEDATPVRSQDQKQQEKREFQIAIRASPVKNRDLYKPWVPKESVKHVVREIDRKGDLMYEIRLTNGTTKKVSLFQRSKLPIPRHESHASFRLTCSPFA